MKDKDKKKCVKMVKKIFGESFFLVHGANGSKIIKILNSGEIKLSTEIPEEEQSFKGYGSDYVYCWSRFDSILVEHNATMYQYSMCISPFILLKDDIIFNSIWSGDPLPEKPLDEIKKILLTNPRTRDSSVNYWFSIHLNINDSLKLRIKKLKIIEKTIAFTITLIKDNNKFNVNLSGEFLIPSRINLKSYLIGIQSREFYYDQQEIKTIIDEKYPTVKLFNITEPTTLVQFPKLIDLCPDNIQ